jgi:hypothetical protein
MRKFMIWTGPIDQIEEHRELEHKIERATWIASRIKDPAVQRIRARIEDLKQKLRQRLEARRIKGDHNTRTRDRGAGRTALGRNLKFWLKRSLRTKKRDRRNFS